MLASLRALVLACAGTVLLALLAMAAYFALNLAATFIDRDAATARIRQAAEAGDFARDVPLPLGADEVLPRIAGNDCRVLAGVVFPYPSRVDEALSPRMTAEEPPVIPPSANGLPKPPCLRLITLAGMADPGAAAGYVYHRYLHGHRLFARVLAPYVPPLALGAITLVATHALVLVLLGAALAQAAARGGAGSAPGRARDHAFAALALAFLLFYGLGLFGWNFSLALPDVVILGFILFAYRYPLGRLGERAFVLTVAGFGVLTAVFEFLTGGIPLGLTVLLGMVALGEAPDRRALVWRAVLGTAVFGTAIAACFAIKLAFLVLYAGPGEAATFFASLSERTGGRFVYGLTPADLARAQHFGFDLGAAEGRLLPSLAYLLFRLGEASHRIAFGSGALGTAVLAGATVLVPTLAVLAWRAPAGADARLPRAETVLLLLTPLVLLLWFLAFVNHTILHAVWMVRVLVWMPALAAVLAVRAAARPEGLGLRHMAAFRTADRQPRGGSV
ncbi:MAG TPA: hypothetical protein VD995_30720 [Azospirillum sp.]|nr:hypothetical protein [Azospirillum sp.]